MAGPAGATGAPGADGAPSVGATADPALGAAVAALAADVANVEAGLVAFSVFDAAGVRIGRVLDYTADASSAVVALTVGATAQLLAPPFGNVVTSSVVYAVNLAESTVARVAPVNNVLGVMPELLYQFPDCSGGPYFRGEASAATRILYDPADGRVWVDGPPVIIVVRGTRPSSASAECQSVPTQGNITARPATPTSTTGIVAAHAAVTPTFSAPFVVGFFAP